MFFSVIGAVGIVASFLPDICGQCSTLHWPVSASHLQPSLLKELPVFKLSHDDLGQKLRFSQLHQIVFLFMFSQTDRCFFFFLLAEIKRFNCCLLLFIFFFLFVVTNFSPITVDSQCATVESTGRLDYNIYINICHNKKDIYWKAISAVNSFWCLNHFHVLASSSRFLVEKPVDCLRPFSQLSHCTALHCFNLVKTSNITLVSPSFWFSPLFCLFDSEIWFLINCSHSFDRVVKVTHMDTIYWKFHRLHHQVETLPIHDCFFHHVFTQSKTFLFWNQTECLLNHMLALLMSTLLN